MFKFGDIFMNLDDILGWWIKRICIDSFLCGLLPVVSWFWTVPFITYVQVSNFGIW